MREEYAGPADFGQRRVRVHLDGDRALVWQAHGHELADSCLALGRYGGPRWSLARHTRLRLSLPSLLGRTERGSRPGRERTLGVWLQRDVLERLLAQAVHATCEMAVYGTLKRWRLAARYAQVTIEWHPDRTLQGGEVARQTPRIGVRQAALSMFTDGVVALEDWTERVASRAPPPACTELELPDELVRRLSGEG